MQSLTAVVDEWSKASRSSTPGRAIPEVYSRRKIREILLLPSQPDDTGRLTTHGLVRRFGADRHKTKAG